MKLVTNTQMTLDVVQGNGSRNENRSGGSRILPID